jgi:hypothetical protein
MSKIISIFVSHPTQYHAPIFRELSKNNNVNIISNENIFPHNVIFIVSNVALIRMISIFDIHR